MLPDPRTATPMRRFGCVYRVWFICSGRASSGGECRGGVIVAKWHTYFVRRRGDDVLLEAGPATMRDVVLASRLDEGQGLDDLVEQLAGDVAHRGTARVGEVPGEGAGGGAMQIVVSRSARGRGKPRGRPGRRRRSGVTAPSLLVPRPAPTSPGPNHARTCETTGAGFPERASPALRA